MVLGLASIQHADEVVSTLKPSGEKLEQQQSKCQTATSAALDQAVHLLLDPKAAGLPDRRAAAISRICRQHTSATGGGGFAVADLPHVTTLLETTLQVITNSSTGDDAAAAAAYVPPLCELLQLIERPLVKHTLTDEVRLPAGMADLMAALGKALAGGVPSTAQFTAVHVLETLATAYHNRPSVLELRASSRQAAVAGSTERRGSSGVEGQSSPQLPDAGAGGDDGASTRTAACWRTYHVHQKLIHSSGVAPATISCLAHALSTPSTPPPADSTQLQAALLRALLAFSYCPAACEQMVQAGVLPLLTAVLQQQRDGAVKKPATTTAAHEHGDLLVTLVIEQLWNLVESSAGHQQVLQLSLEQAAAGGQEPHISGSQTTVGGQLIAALATVFEELLQTAEDRRHKELRNDVLAVLQHLCSFSICAAAAYGCGLINTVLTAAAATLEAVAQSPQTTRYPPVAGRDPLKFEMKLLLWSAAVAAAEADPSCMDAFTGSGGSASSFLALLLSCVEPTGPAVVPAQLVELKAQLPPEHRTMLHRAAWSGLLKIAPLAKKAFINGSDGGAVLVRCLNACVAGVEVGGAAPLLLGVTSGSGNRSSGLLGVTSSTGSLGDSGSSSWSGGVAEAPARMVASLCTGDGASEAAANLCRQGAITPLLQLLLRQGPALQANQPVQQAALLALMAMCSAGGATCLKALRSAKGVAILVNQLEG